MPTESKMPAQVTKLHFGRIKMAQQARNHHFVDIPAGTKPKDILEPTYWAHQARDLRPLDLIEAFCEDGLWEGLYRVMFVGKSEVRLSEIRFTEHESLENTEAESDLYKVKYISPTVRYAVVRKDNGDVVKDHLQMPSDAHAWIQRHLKDMKA